MTFLFRDNTFSVKQVTYALDILLNACQLLMDKHMVEADHSLKGLLLLHICMQDQLLLSPTQVVKKSQLMVLLYVPKPLFAQLLEISTAKLLDLKKENNVKRLKKKTSMKGTDYLILLVIILALQLWLRYMY